MLSPWTEKHLSLQLKVMNIIWIAMMLSQGTLAFVLFSQPQKPDALLPAELLQDPFVQILGLAAIAVLVLSQYAGRLILNAGTMRRLRAEPQNAEHLRSLRTGKGQVPLYSETDIETILALPEQERLIVRLSGPYSVSKILQYALCEACGLLGFMIAFTRHTPVAFLPFAAASILAILSSPPRRSELIDILKRN